MKLHTRTLSGRALDFAVALAEGWTPVTGVSSIANIWVQRANQRGVMGYQPPQHYTTRVSGDEIIDREMISTQVYDASFPAEKMWDAYMPGEIPLNAKEEITGATRREAAMRCWVIHKLGEEVDIPDELMK